jgi:hypothetical protein
VSYFGHPTVSAESLDRWFESVTNRIVPHKAAPAPTATTP